MSMEQCLWLKVSLAACHKVLYLGLCYFFYTLLTCLLQLNASYYCTRVKHNPLCLEQGQNSANVTLLILYVMELSLNQNKPSPI